MNRHQTTRVWAEPLLHPACLVGMAVWWLNDHVGKLYVPCTLTGKASDLAGLIVFPLWVWCLLDGLVGAISPSRYRLSCRARLASLYSVTALVCVWFSLINVSNSLGSFHRDLWTQVYRLLHVALSRVGVYWSPQAHHTVDAHDLWTLPAALIGVWVGRRSLSREQAPTANLKHSFRTRCSAGSFRSVAGHSRL